MLEDVNWENIARSTGVALNAWQNFAEIVWEELQEWHHPECPDQTRPFTGCTCHRIIWTLFDKLTNAADWADSDDKASQ